MGYTPHYIASFEADSGQFTYYEPFLIPEKAFPILQDAWCYRGRVLRKQGYRLLGRLQRDLTALSGTWNITSPGAGVVVSNIFTGLGLAATEPNAQIVPGTIAHPNIINIGGVIGQTLTDQTSDGNLLIAPAGIIASATLDYSTGNITMIFGGAAAASATTFTGSYYPGLPVMGLRTREVAAVNQEELITFDTKYTYTFTAGRFQELTPIKAVPWQGTNSDFFWTTNYWKIGNNKVFWISNDHMAGAASDGMFYHDTTAWTAFAPLITAAETLYNAKAFLPYHDRLVMVNTWEGTTVGTITAATNNPQRVRWSAIGDPTNAAVNAWRSDIVGQGGFLDIPTSEAIVSIEYIKDILLVKCERSSWKLVYTGNEALPFIAQKINAELGSESAFSLVPFDKGVFAVGNYGITTDDSVNVERIDLQIPETIFNFNNNRAGTSRVHGIRDYFKEVVYWCFPNAPDHTTYPNRVLLYNYRNNTYATFTDSFTTFGYYQSSTEKTWSQLNDLTWAQWNIAWNSGQYQPFFPDVVSGTQHGFVEILNKKSLNDQSLFISSINFGVTPIQFTIPNHNLQTGDIILISGVIGGAGSAPDPGLMDGHTYLVSKLTDDVVTLEYFDATAVPPNPSFIDLATAGVAGPGSIYIGGGVVSKYNNMRIATKVFVPFYETGSQCRLGYIDYLITRTPNGEMTSNVFVNEDTSMSVNDNPGVVVGNNVVLTRPENTTLIPQQSNQTKIWHRQFIQAIAQNFQIVMTMSPTQNANEQINQDGFELHAMAFYISPNARLTQ